MKKQFFVKKIKAFTLIELSVVMAVAGMVFAISYSAYHIISRQYSEFRNASEKIIGISALNAVLAKDFSEAKKIEKGSDELLVEKPGGSQVIYSFEPGEIIRRINEAEDRFPGISNVKISFMGEEQSETSGLVDELYCEIGKEAFPLHIKKYYAADVLMEAEQMNK